MKNFIAQIDISIIEFIPQKTQVDILKTFTKKNEEIINYSVENLESRHSFLSLKNILKNQKNIDGVIFFSLIQFCYDNQETINLNFLKNLLKKYNLIFFRENLRFKNLNDLKKMEKNLKLFKYNNLSLINKFKF